VSAAPARAVGKRTLPAAVPAPPEEPAETA
jgi:hypothetical protein